MWLRDLDLIFPSSMATAMSIHSMHSAADGEKAAHPALKATIYSFGAAMLLRIVSQYVPGVLWVGENTCTTMPDTEQRHRSGTSLLGSPA